MIGSLLVAITPAYREYSLLHHTIIINVETYRDYSGAVITELQLLMSDGIVEHDCFYHIDAYLKNFEVCCLVG